ncbi:MAG: DMT family transporter [Methanoregula sp.]|jgi:drug/metabolite transporter (DMT)-like permease|nr:DMT family transporter [Methanoregula sp.]
MFWFLLALSGAISQAIYSLSVKVLLKKIPPFLLAGYSFLAASLIFFPVLLFSGIPSPGPGLFPALAGTVIINTLATILFYRALSTTDISLCVPILAFTPVFLILTSFIMLGEIPSPAGAAGILLVTAGAFLLTFRSGQCQSFSRRSPFRIFLYDPGIRSMLFVAFLYSISVNYDKEVVMNSSPVFASAITLFLLAIIFLLIAMATMTKSTPGAGGPEEPDPVVSGHPFLHSPFFLYGTVGMILVVEGISINSAYTMAIVPYVITVKRLSLFFSVLFGGLVLHEEQIRGRMAGALIMILGVVVIGLGG